MPAGLLCSIEDHVEVCLLTQIREVNNPICTHHEQTVVNCSQVCGIVAEAAVSLDCHEGDLGDAWTKDAHCPLAFNAEVPGLQLLNKGRDHGVVIGLASLFGLDAQPCIDLVEGFPAHIADLLPCVLRELPTALQVNDCYLRFFLELLIVVESFLCRLVEGVQVADIWHLSTFEEPRVSLLHVFNQHAELRSPITDVVQPVHLMATKLEDSAASLPEDGRPQVADVHLLGNVRRGEIDDNTLDWLIDILDVLAQHVSNLRGQPCLRELGGHEALRGDGNIRENIILRNVSLDGLSTSGWVCKP
mmetsp:Transcript_42975/g.108043  ORF Transcript_42975/g.108043 Transcript_42975/m.108043 type:complete len:303 (+) Transcript_42975:761-1669(+)